MNISNGEAGDKPELVNGKYEALIWTQYHRHSYWLYDLVFSLIIAIYYNNLFIMSPN